MYRALFRAMEFASVKISIRETLNLCKQISSVVLSETGISRKSGDFKGFSLRTIGYEQPPRGLVLVAIAQPIDSPELITVIAYHLNSTPSLK